MRRQVPTLAFQARVSVEVDELRRRLQDRTGWTVPLLLEEALKYLEKRLDAAERGPAG